MTQSGSRSLLIVSALIFVATVLVYQSTGNYDFVNFDDYVYVKNNAHVTTGLNVENILWSFTSIHAGYWIPVTWLSYMLDAQLFGNHPGVYHLSNVVLHALASVVLYLLLFRLTSAQAGSASVALLFALHPLHVESVAWITERKDVLSGLFGFLAMLYYVKSVTERDRTARYLSLCAFVLSLLAKPMLVTLPVILLLLDFWPLGRFNAGALPGGEQETGGRWKIYRPYLQEKLEYFLVALLFLAIAIYTQAVGGMAVGVDRVSFHARLANAATSYLKYLGKIFWPVDLAVFYPHPLAIPSAEFAAAALFLGVVSAVVFVWRSKYPFFLVGWFWFLVTLVPVIGLLQVGDQAMADRFTYLPAIGIFITVTWGMTTLLQDLPVRNVFLGVAALMVVFLSTVMTLQQLQYWQNTVTLFQRAVAVTSNNAVAHTRLGHAYVERGNIEQAIEEFKSAVAIDNNNGAYHNSLGVAYARNAQYPEAIEEFGKAIDLEPDSIQAHLNLAQACERIGRLDVAIAHYETVIALDPENGKARAALAGIHAGPGASGNDHAR